MSRRGVFGRAMAVGMAVMMAGVPLPSGASGTSPAATPSPVRLKVMTFNIEYGGTVIDFRTIVEAVRKADADVVGFEEAYAHVHRVAAALGWGYVNGRLDVLSRFPLIDPPGGAGHYVFVQVQPGRVAAIANVHLPSTPYGPRRLMEGWTVQQVLDAEREIRVPAIRPTLDALGPLVAMGIPTFLVGDFNTPSHRDWIPEAVGLRPHVTAAVPWPVTRLIESRGFRDSVRDVYPDPVTHQELSWPAKRPDDGTGYPPPGAPADRIDLIFAAGPTEAVSTTLVGERGGPGVDIGLEIWGSDHRGVMSTFDVDLAAPPIMVAADRRLMKAGEDVAITYHAPGADGERIVVVPAGGAVGDVLASRATLVSAPVDGSLMFDTGAFGAGTFDALLVDGTGRTLSRNRFWAKPPPSRTRLSTSEAVYERREPITIEWNWAPGNRFDWIGLYRRGADPNIAYYKGWFYTGASIQGRDTYTKEDPGIWPLKPGYYSAYLLLDDGYQKVGRVDFRVLR
jgi:endonuclease/exonuclease/phosphatase family metal-dependent hydrolase